MTVRLSQAAVELEELFHESTNVFMDMNHSPKVLEKLIDLCVGVSDECAVDCVRVPQVPCVQMCDLFCASGVRSLYSEYDCIIPQSFICRDT